MWNRVVLLLLVIHLPSCTTFVSSTEFIIKDVDVSVVKELEEELIAKLLRESYDCEYILVGDIEELYCALINTSPPGATVTVSYKKNSAYVWIRDGQTSWFRPSEDRTKSHRYVEGIIMPIMYRLSKKYQVEAFLYYGGGEGNKIELKLNNI